MRIIILLCFVFNVGIISAQKTSIPATPALQTAENVRVQKIYSDSNATTFIIWVKDQVPLHKHETHTEQVYVMSGTANMTLGDSVFQIQTGDIIVIPAGTPHAVKVTSDTPLQVISMQAPYFDGSDRVMLTGKEE